MGTMISSFVALVLFLMLMRLLVALVAATVRVVRGGTDDAREFDRAGVGLERFWKAEVRKQDSSSLVPTRAGIGVRFKNGQFEVRETRTISKDVF